ncbi:MAG: ABC transporter permease subunit [Anaerolineales bacterium]|nr:ABC transporter permease subunit [Anaerolineales bacterium]
MAKMNGQIVDKEIKDSGWEQDLQRVGFIRGALRARKWYGADWWFVTISAVMVVGFITLALFPGPFAPYGPHEIVGSSFLAPGEHPPVAVLIVPQESPFNVLKDLAVPDGSPRPSIAVEQGLPTASALREQAQFIDNQLRDEPEGLRLRARIERYPSLEQTLQAVLDGDVQAAVVQSTEFEQIADQFPDLREGESITGETASAGGFLLGTNEIGQDVFSRLIWGTRVALLIGFSSSIVALVLGVPLGLFAAYVGGTFDRYLSLLMDSLYAFPGLILAIAITAVLGPSVFNVIVAISVLYIPTYYRIVRGQTFTVKEELYVEAARSIGARQLEILRRYIFPNVIPSVAIIFSVNVADAILTGAGLSFLGLGLPPTIADWGIDLARGQRFIQTAWWLITFPGFTIMLVVLAFTLMGEGLMEIFNPKLRER